MLKKVREKKGKGAVGGLPVAHEFTYSMLKEIGGRDGKGGQSRKKTR